MSKSKNKLTVGITLGDPAGIGPEVVAKALHQLGIRRLANFVVIGDSLLFQRFKNNFSHCLLDDVENPFVAKVKSGFPSRFSAQAGLNYLNRAIDLLKTDSIQALVTAPLSKESICRLGLDFDGHTEYLASAFHSRRCEMMFVGPRCRIVVATRHVPLKEIPRLLNHKNLFETIKLSHSVLKNLFKISRPHIGVCGLNPHAGEGGHMGHEETTKIIPAIHEARQKGLYISGPFAADTLFAMNRYQQFDAIIAMYHDQGLIPIKTLFFTELVNLTIGLPFIRTSPAHGTAFDIAGKNKANAHSMIAAIKLAVKLSQ